MASPEMVLADVQRRFSSLPVEERYIAVYGTEDPRLSGAFAWFHSELDRLFSFMNFKRMRGGHYNADESRELIDRTREIGVCRDSSVALASRSRLTRNTPGP